MIQDLLWQDMVKEIISSGQEAYFDGYLISQLDNIVYNIKNDWDFVILITGDRMVRTGKSVLAMNICSYLAKRLNTPYTLDNLFFDGKTMMEKSFNFPKNSIIHYDEGAESLRKGHQFSYFQYRLGDFFNEVGQMNHIFVIVLPDFFDLIEPIAVGRSEFLINVYRTEQKKMIDIYNEGKQRPIVEFGRGRFVFYNREKKQELYDLSNSKKKKSYNLVKGNFFGIFSENYPLNESKYREKKMYMFKRFEKKDIESKKDTLRDKVIEKLYKEGMERKEIGQYLKETYNFEITPRYLMYILQNIRRKDINIEDNADLKKIN